MSPKEKKEKSLLSIFNSLIELSKNKPFDTISISELCQKAGVSRTYFYNNFTTFDDIIMKTQTLYIMKYLRSLPRTQYKSMEQLISLYFKIYQSYKESYLSLIELSKQKILIEVFSNVYFYLRNNNHIRRVSSKPKIDERYWSEFISGAVVNVCSEWLKSDNKTSPEQMGKIVTSFCNPN